MAKRFTIGLNYFFDNQSNSGIVNYIYNIIAALKTLDDDKKPNIVLFYAQNAPVDYLKKIEYPFIEYVLFRPYPRGYILQKANNLIRKVFKKDIYKQVRYYSKIDSLYPYFELVDYHFADFKRKIHWLVDFNNKVFPDHYVDKGENMLKIQQKVTSSSDCVVLSSNSLLNELKQYYPGYKCDVKILPFASSISNLEENDVFAVKEKYSVQHPYFMSPNQLWEHKNQSVILDALNIVKRNRPGLKLKVLFSGSLEVNRGKGLYIDILLSKVKEYELEDYVLFLGVVERQDQLLLMMGANALIQPSLYEGWSTLVEEAKALNKFIILSDLPIHREQIDKNVAFFNAIDAAELAEKIIQQLQHPASVTITDYSRNVENYGRDILKALTINK